MGNAPTPTLWSMIARPTSRLPLALFCGLYAVYATSWLTEWANDSALSEVGYLAIHLGFAASLLTRAIIASKHRRAWAVLGVGYLIHFSASMYDMLVLIPRGQSTFPTIADGGWLMIYPFAITVLVMLIKTEVGVLPAMTWLDGAITLFGASAVITSLVLGLLVENKAGDTIAVLVALAYPIGDALIIGMMVGFVTITKQRPSPMWSMLLAGVLVYAVSDIVYLAQLSRGTYQAGSWLEVAWVGGVTVIGLAAWSSDEAPPLSTNPRANLAAIALPITFAVLALSVITAGAFIEVPAAAIVLAGATLGLVVVRTAASFHQAQLLGTAQGEARTDDLTGLANRRFFYEELTTRLKRRPKDRDVSIILLDLTRFKEVNDAFGHEAGDRILDAVGARIAAAIRTTDFVSRLGSDQFIVIIDGDIALAHSVATRLRADLIRPFDIGHLTTAVDASFGISSSPRHSTSADRLVQQADRAMLFAKDQRGGVQVYEPGSDIDVLERAKTVQELQRDVSTDAMVVHYQPKLDLRTDQITGVEALVRWQHPTRGLLYPDAFLALTEQSGLMQRLTHNVLSTSLRQAATWRAAGLDLTMSVNLSPSDLRTPGLADWVSSLLAENGLTGTALRLELTEDVLMSDPELGRRVLTQLRQIGISVSIDDYGTGYSSLAYLEHLPVDELKLDRSFVMQLDSNENSAPIVKSTIELAHALGLLFVAEGVETESSLKSLAAWGCDIAQGYFIGRPGCVEQVTDLIVKSQASGGECELTGQSQPGGSRDRQPITSSAESPSR